MIQRFVTTEETQRLTREYPVRETLGNFIEYIQQEGRTGTDLWLFLRGTAGTMEAEAFALAQFIRPAIQEDQWLGYNTGWTRETLEAFNRGIQTGNLGSFGRGIAQALDNGLIGLEEIEGKICVIPKENLIRIMQERARGY